MVTKFSNLVKSSRFLIKRVFGCMNFYVHQVDTRWDQLIKAAKSHLVWRPGITRPPHLFRKLNVLSRTSLIRGQGCACNMMSSNVCFRSSPSRLARPCASRGWHTACKFALLILLIITADSPPPPLHCICLCQLSKVAKQAQVYGWW